MPILFYRVKMNIYIFIELKLKNMINLKRISNTLIKEK